MPSVRLFKKDSSNLFKIELFLEFVNTSAGVNEFLFTGEERVAFRAYINLNIIFCRFSCENLATGTFYCCFFKIGMYSCLHCHITPLVYFQFANDTIPYFFPDCNRFLKIFLKIIENPEISFLFSKLERAEERKFEKPLDLFALR